MSRNAFFSSRSEKNISFDVRESASLIVISPLKSIIDDHISEMLSLNFTAMELLSDKVNLVRNNRPQFLYCSAEAALEKPFLAALREDSELHRAVSAILVDESHTVEAWTGKWQDSIFAFCSDFTRGEGVVYSLIWAILVCAAPKDMVFSYFGHK